MIRWQPFRKLLLENEKEITYIEAIPIIEVKLSLEINRKADNLLFTKEKIEKQIIFLLLLAAFGKTYRRDELRKELVSLQVEIKRIENP